MDGEKPVPWRLGGAVAIEEAALVAPETSCGPSWPSSAPAITLFPTHDLGSRLELGATRSAAELAEVAG